MAYWLVIITYKAHITKHQSEQNMIKLNASGCEELFILFLTSKREPATATQAVLETQWPQDISKAGLSRV